MDDALSCLAAYDYGYDDPFSLLPRKTAVCVRLTCVLDHLGMQTVWVFGNASSILAKFPSPPYVDGYLEFGGDAYGNDTYDPLVDWLSASSEK